MMQLTKFTTQDDCMVLVEANGDVNSKPLLPYVAEPEKGKDARTCHNKTHLLHQLTANSDSTQ